MFTRIFQIRRTLHPLLQIGLIAVITLGSVATGAFAIWTIRPLFIDNRVEEAFPAALSRSTSGEPDSVTATPTNAMATLANAMATLATPTNAMTTPAILADTMAKSTIPTEPIALTSGAFTKIDSLHAAEGTATIYQLPDGTQLIRLENFNATNGPDLFIGLSGHTAPRTSTALNEQGYLELARLKGNQGNQNYEIPSDIDLSMYKSVVIYCKAFSVIFSTAELIAW